MQTADEADEEEIDCVAAVAQIGHPLRRTKLTMLCRCNMNRAIERSQVLGSSHRSQIAPQRYHDRLNSVLARFLADPEHDWGRVQGLFRQGKFRDPVK